MTRASVCSFLRACVYLCNDVCCDTDVKNGGEISELEKKTGSTAVYIYLFFLSGSFPKNFCLCSSFCVVLFLCDVFRVVCPILFDRLPRLQQYYIHERGNLYHIYIYIYMERFYFIYML